MSYQNLHYSPFETLPAHVIDLILQYLEDEDIPVFQVLSKSTFASCFEYLRHNREKSRLERDECVRSIYPGDFTTLPHAIQSRLHKAYFSVVRRSYARKTPRFYTIFISLHRLNANEISKLLDCYQDNFSYTFIRKNENCDPFDRNEYLHLSFDILKKFYKRVTTYELIFDTIKSLQTLSASWAHSEVDLVGRPHDEQVESERVQSRRPYASEFTFRCITLDI